MKNVALYNVDQLDQLAWPDNYQVVTLDSPAIDVFTDFKKSKPLLIKVYAPASDVERRMIEERVSLKIVLDEANKFVGVISLGDLTDQEVIKRIATGIQRSELLVSNFMRHKEQQKVILLSELKDDTAHQIRGTVSASDLV
ncbi:MAG: signal-transduction protein with cAMP-binding, CBS, and nucleotidyltransferase domain [Paraglaciecola sp.]|jgi:signal-transduction protein with cAMP-binding, CBS, and nucleotidyltransferase domain